MILATIVPLAQQSSAEAGPNWPRAVAILGVLAALVLFREAIMWLIHHAPRRRRDTRDDGDGADPDRLEDQ